MAEESHRSSAAEIPVTSNGDLDQSPETVFQRVRVYLENSISQNYIIEQVLEVLELNDDIFNINITCYDICVCDIYFTPG